MPVENSAVGSKPVDKDNKLTDKDRERFNLAAFAYKDPIPTTPLTPEPEKPKSKPGFVSLYETPEEKEARFKQTKEEIGGINQLNPDGSNREEFNYASFAFRDPKAKEPEVATIQESKTSQEPEKTKEEEVKPFIIDVLVQQGTQAEKYSAEIEEIRRAGDEVEKNNMNSLGGIRGAIKTAFQKVVAEVRKSRDFEGKTAKEIIFGSKTLEEARRIQDQIASEGASLLANDMFNATTPGAKFEKVYTSLDGNPEFEIAKKELAQLIKKYATLDPVTNSFLARDDFEKEKDPIVERIMSLAKEANDPQAVKDTIDGFWINVEKLRAQNLSVQKIADMEIVLNIKLARASFLRQTEIQENLSNNLAQTLRQTPILNKLPVKYRDVIAVAIPTAAAMGARMAASPIAGWLTFGVAPLASGLISGSIEAKRKHDETTTTRSSLARDLAGGKDPREVLKRYNPEQISATVNQVNIRQLTNEIIAGLSDLDTNTTPTENDARVNQVLNSLARYMALTELSAKDKFDYFSASSDEELVEAKAQAASVALAVKSKIKELKDGGLITLDVSMSYRNKFQAELESQTKAAQVNSELFNSLRTNLTVRSSLTKGAQAAAASLIFGGIGYGVSHFDAIPEEAKKVYEDFAEGIVKNFVQPGSAEFDQLLARLGLNSTATSLEVVKEISSSFPTGKVPDFARPEYSGITTPTSVADIINNPSLTENQIKGATHQFMFQTSESYKGLTIDNCDPTETVGFEKTGTKDLSISEILSNPQLYPSQYSEIIRNGVYTGGEWSEIQLNPGESWDFLLNQSEVVDKSEIFSISDPKNQVAEMNTLTHSYWNSADRDILNITGRDFLKDESGGFIEHTKKILENGESQQTRVITPFNDFLSDKVSSNKFDVMVYLKDGNVVRVPSEYINLTNNGVEVDFKKVPGIIGEIWKSGNLGLAEAVRYGYETDNGSHALVSTIHIGGPADDLTIVDKVWNSSQAQTFTTNSYTEILEDCPTPDPIPTPTPTPEVPVIPVVLFGPGYSGTEKRYLFKNSVNPEDGTIKNERKINLNKPPVITINPTELKSKSNSEIFKNDTLLNEKQGVIETLSKAAVQAAAILELLNENDLNLKSSIMDIRRMLIINLEILHKKIELMLKTDPQNYGFLEKDNDELQKIIRILKNSNVSNQVARDLFQTKLSQILKQYFGQFYKNPTTEVPKVDVSNTSPQPTAQDIEQPVQNTLSTNPVQENQSASADKESNFETTTPGVSTVESEIKIEKDKNSPDLEATSESLETESGNAELISQLNLLNRLFTEAFRDFTVNSITDRQKLNSSADKYLEELDKLTDQFEKSNTKTYLDKIRSYTILMKKEADINLAVGYIGSIFYYLESTINQLKKGNLP